MLSWSIMCAQKPSTGEEGQAHTSSSQTTYSSTSWRARRSCARPTRRAALPLWPAAAPRGRPAPARASPCSEPRPGQRSPGRPVAAGPPCHQRPSSDRYRYRFTQIERAGGRVRGGGRLLEKGNVSLTACPRPPSAAAAQSPSTPGSRLAVASSKASRAPIACRIMGWYRMNVRVA